VTRPTIPTAVLRPTGLAAAAIVAVVVGGRLAPNGLPAGIVAVGLLVGSLNALVAVGLVLIYRAGRYVNFAQGGVGAAGAVVAAKMISVNHINYFIAVLCGLATSALLAFLVEITFIKRLFRAPRLIVTVATIGLAQLFGSFEAFVGLVWTDKLHTVPKLSVPLHVTFKIGGVFFHGEHVMVLIVVPLVLGGLIGFFRYTDFGAAVQAAAENGDRARLLGVSVRRVSTMIWVLAGLLAGITAVLEAPIVGFTFGSGSGPGLLLRALAPAMIAGMTGLGTAVVAALGLGVIEQALVWNTSASGPVELALFLVILVALLVQRSKASRTTEGEERSFAIASAIRPFPRELARIPSVAAVRLGTKLAVAAVAVTLPLALSISQRSLASLVLIYAMAALSLTLLSGYAGQVSFGHWAFVGFGALLGGWLVTVHHLNMAAAGLVVCMAGAVLALLIGLPALRIRGLFLAVTTLAFAVAANSYLFTWSIFKSASALDRPRFMGIDFDNETVFYYLCLGLLLLTLWVVRNIRSSRWGRNLVAVRDNDKAAASFGVGVITTKLIAFAASGFIASMAGYLYLLSQSRVNAGSFPVEASLLLFSAVVIGGLGSVPGALLGALYLRGIQFFAPTVQLFSTSFGLLLVLTLFPQGLGGLAFEGRDAILRWLARRWDLTVPSLVADKQAPGEALAAPPMPTPTVIAKGA
jgi:branched-chain amino acid transport system permease protein